MYKLFITDESQPDSILHPDEHREFKSQKRQQEYVRGRYAAKRALGGDFAVLSGVFQQPYVVGTNLGVSISHSGKWAAALAFPESHPMAIDIERIDPKRHKAIESQMTDRELAMIAEVENGHFVFWTAKEALSKVLRCGLMTSFKILEIDTAGSNEATFKHFPQYKAHSFFKEDLVCTIVLPKNVPLSL